MLHVKDGVLQWAKAKRSIAANRHSQRCMMGPGCNLSLAVRAALRACFLLLLSFSLILLSSIGCL